MARLSLMSANYVAQQVGYQMTEGWMQGQNAVEDWFRPLETYAERFGKLLADVQALGFDTLDVWLAHLSPVWGTPDHIAIARDLLAQHGLTVASLAGWFGGTTAEFEASCKLAQAVNTTVLGGGTSLHKSGNAEERATMIGLLRDYGLKFGIENHPEKTPQDILDQIGDSGDVIGTAVDTGWWATQGYDALAAMKALREHIVHVHLKDIRAAGAHETCRFGEGIVPLEACVQYLRASGYDGYYSIEHEPEHFDPTEDVRVSAALVKGWFTS